MTVNDSRWLRVDEDSRAVKQELGATAWVVLEDVALDAHLDDAGRLLASTTVRRVATLGLTPGTVARAIARLCAHGIVHREDRRDPGSGRFGESVYVIHKITGLSLCIDLPHTVEPDAARPVTASPSVEVRHTARSRTSGAARPRRVAELGQLTLLDDGPDRPIESPAPPPRSTPSSSPSTPRNRKPQTNPNPEPNQNSQEPPHPNPLNTTPQRPTDICHPSGEAGPGRASC